jgi:ABC-type glycerol-3-phosphate transport system permease component
MCAPIPAPGRNELPGPPGRDGLPRAAEVRYLSVLILIMIVPVVAMAIALERYIRRGMLIGAVKG